ncbi:MAG TPA: UDP-glucose/GDP-mannose dehydrogenase family protein [Candidatus Bilamarchaeum sp.]|nr:UDP-glucose/GDP-mannose dehydrogenase family protein [Candidatus Bilamarchaeum sp.]
MKISIIGTGYVGLVTAACFAEKGHEVACVDLREDVVRKINSGIPTIHEPGLAELLARNSGKRLRATTSVVEAVSGTDISFICVGTPSHPDGSIDTSQVEKASRDIGAALKSKPGRHVVVVKSTVVPGTAAGIVLKALSESSGKSHPSGFGIASNPEFLREGSAVRDSMEPDRIVIGAEDEETRKAVAAVYEGMFGGKIISVNTRTAEMIKYANNSLLATLISFSNEIGDICESIEGVDAEEVLRAVTLDSRINPRRPDGSPLDPQIIGYLRAGCGYGGSCFPKDVSALISFSKKTGDEAALLSEVRRINSLRPGKIIERLKAAAGPLKGKKAAVLGTAFKQDTDDVRESPAVPLIRLLLAEGARVTATDPAALENTRRVFGDMISYADEPRDALKGAHMALVLTKWNDFSGIGPEEFRSLMAKPVLFDGRRIYDRKKYSEGIAYIGTGVR